MFNWDSFQPTIVMQPGLLLLCMVKMWALLVAQISACNAGNSGSIPGGGEDSLERGYPLKYPCLEHFIDRGAWQAIVQWGVTRRHDWVTKHSTALHYHSKVSMKDSKDRSLGLEGWATGWENQVTGQEGRAARHTISRPGSLVDLSAAIWNRLELVTPLCLSFLLLKQKCL